MNDLKGTNRWGGAAVSQRRHLSPRLRDGQAFTLLELIGVLAIIAALLAALLPRIFDAVDNARLRQTATTLHTLKTAAVQHCAKYGSLALDGSLSPPGTIVPEDTDARSTQYDQVLLAEGLVDAPFRVRIGDGILDATHTRIQIVRPLAATATVDGSNAAYDLDAVSTSNDVTGTVLLEAVITGVTLMDARALNQLLDGSLAGLGEDAGGNDFYGRVKYSKVGDKEDNGKGGGKKKGHDRADTAEVHFYLFHN